jgi:uncharacterized membrane protein
MINDILIVEAIHSNHIHLYDQNGKNLFNLNDNTYQIPKTKDPTS